MDVKYSAIALDGLFNDDYPTGKFKVQGKAKTEGCPFLLSHKWDKGYNLKMSYKRPLCCGFKADGSIDVTPKGEFQPGCNITHGNWWTTVKYNANVEVGLKDSKLGPCMVGATALYNIEEKTKSTAHVQVAYTTRVNAGKLGVGGKVKYEDAEKEVKPELTLAYTNDNGMHTSFRWEVLKNVVSAYAGLKGPVVADFKTTMFAVVTTTKQKLSNIGLALQIEQDFFKLKAKIEKLNTDAPVPALSAIINHKPVKDASENVEFTFACEWKESQPRLGFQASFL